MKKFIIFIINFFTITFRLIAQDSTVDLQEKIRELESLVTVLQAKLAEVNEYKFCLYTIIGVIIFLMIVGINASFRRKISYELNAVKRQLIEKYRESIVILAVDTEEAIGKEKNKIALYNRKLVELIVAERDYVVKDWLIRGLDFLYEERFHDSIAAFEKAISMEPDNCNVYYNMAVAYGFLEKNDKAVRNYRKAIELKADFPEAWCNIGSELEILEKHEEAVEAYNTAIELRPDYPKAYEKMGTDLRKLERKEEAVQTYDKMGDTLLRMGREDEAVEAYNNMALDLIKLGLDDNSEEPLIIPSYPELDLEALQQEQESLKIYYRQGNGYLKFDKFEEAIDSFDRIIDLRPDDLEARFIRAKILLRMGREDDSLAAFKEVTSKDPSHVKAQYFLGKALMEMGNCDKAVRAFNRVIELMPDYPETYHKLACLFAKENNENQVFIYLSKYFELSISGTEENVERNPLFKDFINKPQFQKLLSDVKSKVS